MKTYSIQKLDDMSVHNLPITINSIDEALDYAREHFSEMGQVRLCEHFWHNVYTTPHLVRTDDGRNIPPPPEAPTPPELRIL